MGDLLTFKEARDALVAELGNAVFEAPPRYRDLSRETWDEARRRWPRSADEFAESGGWLLLHGSVGTGKTHVALGAARAYLDARPDLSVSEVVFVDCGRWLQDVRDDSRRRWDRYSTCGLLVLDDLRGVRAEWPFEIVRLILRDRHMAERDTLVTTNIKPDDLAAQDPQLLSRIASGRMASFEGEDERFRRKEGAT